MNLSKLFKKIRSRQENPVAAKTKRVIGFTAAKNHNSELRAEFLRACLTLGKRQVFVNASFNDAGTTETAARLFQEVHSIESSPELHEAAKTRFADKPNVTCDAGEAAVVLKGLLPMFHGRTVFLRLGSRGRGDAGTPVQAAALEAIRASGLDQWVIALDMLRDSTGGGFPNVAPPSRSVLEELIRSIDPGAQIEIWDDLMVAFSRKTNCIPGPAPASPAGSGRRVEAFLSGVAGSGETLPPGGPSQPDDGAPRLKLNLGCAKDVRPGYVNVDMHYQHPDVVNADICQLSFVAAGSVDEILARDVLEHIPYDTALECLRTWFGYLKPGGLIIIQTTNFARITRAFESGVWDLRALNYMLFSGVSWIGGAGSDCDFHKSVYEPAILAAEMTRIGYRIQSISEDSIDGALQSDPYAHNLNLVIHARK